MLTALDVTGCGAGLFPRILDSVGGFLAEDYAERSFYFGYAEPDRLTLDADARAIFVGDCLMLNFMADETAVVQAILEVERTL